MKIIFKIILVGFFLYSCSNKLYSDYVLVKNSDYISTKRYPQEVPEMELKINSDSTGIIFNENDQSIKQHFSFIKRKKYCLIITDLHGNNLLNLKTGDTLIHYKTELYILHKGTILTFRKK